MAYLLGIMSIIIYQQMYGADAIVDTMDTYDNIMTAAMNNSVFSSMVSTVQAIAVGICVLLYFIDLSEKVTEKNFSTEQFFKATLRCVTAYMFIMYAKDIAGYLLSIGSASAQGLAEVTANSGFFSGSAGADNREYLVNGIRKYTVLEILGYIVNSFIPFLLAVISAVILQVILISRVMETIVMTIFSPLAVSNIYREGTSSPGVVYMKKLLALGLQITAILVINIATQAVIMELAGSGAADSITGLLKTTEQEGETIFSKDSITDYLNAVTGRENTFQILGIMLARVGLVWNSLALCEEVTGAR